ncbi:MAG: hypothetical protein AAFO62_06250 [Pseudomonadota bacterium]
MAEPDKKTPDTPRRRIASKSFVDRMTSGEVDPEEFERERQAAAQQAAEVAKANKV